MNALFSGIKGAQTSLGGLIVVNIVMTVKPVLSWHPKTDKIKVLNTNSCLMKVESIADTFDLH